MRCTDKRVLDCNASGKANTLRNEVRMPTLAQWRQLPLSLSFRAERPIMGAVLGGKVAASGGCGWGAGLGRVLATGPGWRQGKRPARMRCSDAGRPSPGTTGVVGSVSQRR